MGRRDTLLRRLVVVLAASACVLTVAANGALGANADPAGADPPVTSSDLQPEPDLERLQTDLAAAEQQVVTATTAARASAGRAVGAQIAQRQAERDFETARAQLSTDVRRALVTGPVATMPGWVVSPEPGDAGLLGEMRQRAVTRRSATVTDLQRARVRLDGAGRTLDVEREAATRQAARAVLAADNARRLLDQGQQIRAANDAVRAQLDARRRELDALNATLLASLAPVQATKPPSDASTSGSLPEAVNSNPDGTKPDASAAAQAAVLRVLEATPPGQLPAGYRPSGQVFVGESSWYGPGFIGSPTSTGVPYDPEKLTSAMLKVPLGTVVRVTTSSGKSVNLLVNDHGPYVGNRIIDVSMRANRILNLGLGVVRVEVLRPV